MDPRILRGREILEHEAKVLRMVADRVGEEFARVVDAILALRGRVVTTGMGKAGIIAGKISATFASTGTPSITLHPADAIHGDLGRVMEGDLLLAFSKSGETEEVLRLLAPVKAASVPVVAATQTRDSTLGRHADVVLELGPIEECGPFALALVVQEGRDFGPEEFARFHPGGDLGRRLMKVSELMRKGERCPVVRVGTTVLRACEVMTRTPGRPGATSVADADGRLVGFFTDGDLRRLIERGNERLQELRERPIEEVMTASPRTIGPDTFALEALAFLHQHRVDQVPVIDPEGRLLGLLDVQDLLDLKIG